MLIGSNAGLGTNNRSHPDGLRGVGADTDPAGGTSQLNDTIYLRWRSAKPYLNRLRAPQKPKQPMAIRMAVASVESLAAAAVGTGTVTGAITALAAPLATAINGIATVAANLSGTLQEFLATTISGVSTITADIRVVDTISASVVGSATISADLSGTDPAPVVSTLQPSVSPGLPARGRTRFGRPKLHG
jgi:hypothetical protein